MRAVALAVAIGSGVFASVPPASAAVTMPEGVTVRVYTPTPLDPVWRQRALEAAAAVLTEATGHVRWIPCDGADACQRTPPRGELVVRLVNGPQIRRAGAAAALHAHSGLPLGDALVDVAAGAGVLATVYVDRVRLLATMAQIDAAVLLGRAIAHEVGHLLLGTNAHSAAGLMRPRWSAQDIRSQAADHWTFTTRERRAIRSRLGNQPRPSTE